MSRDRRWRGPSRALILLVAGLLLPSEWSGLATARAQDNGPSGQPPAGAESKKPSRGRSKSARKKGRPAGKADSPAGEAGTPGGLKFSQDIAPILVANCSGCHSGNGAGLRRGKLDLTSFANLRKGTPDHEVIVPGKPEESHLVLRINGEEEPKMPQGGNRALSAEAIARITRWVKEGARLDAGIDPAKPMNSYAATPEDLRRMELARLPEKERDRKVIEAGQARWKQSGAKEEAKVATAAHFIAFHDLPAGRAEGALKTLEVQYNQMKRLLGPSRMDWPEKASLYIFNDNARYVEFVRTVEGREVDPQEPQLSVRFNVSEPYIAAVDPNGGKKEEPVRRRGRGRRKEESDSGPERSLAGVLTEGLGQGSVAAAGKAPRWLREGIGTFLASGLEPRSPYYQRLRQSAVEDFAQNWQARATQALGDQLPAGDLRAMGFALVECLMRSESSHGFPVLLEDLLQDGQGATDDAIRRAFGANREEFIQYTGRWVATHYGRAQ